VSALAAGGPTGVVLTDTPPSGWDIRYRKQEVCSEGADFRALLRMLDRMVRKDGRSEKGNQALVQTQSEKRSSQPSTTVAYCSDKLFSDEKAPLA